MATPEILRYIFHSNRHTLIPSVTILVGLFLTLPISLFWRVQLFKAQKIKNSLRSSNKPPRFPDLTVIAIEYSYICFL